MKKLFIVLALCLFATNGYGLTATWNPSIGADGYILYLEQDGVTRHFTIPGDATEFQFSVAPGRYECYMTAYNVAGESEKSNTVVYTLSPFVPPADDPPEPMPSAPEPPTGFDLISQGFSMIWNGIKGLI